MYLCDDGLDGRFDFLVAGAGFSGAVIAERLASQLNKRVLVVEKRKHIGGNAFDYYDEAGLLVHRHGPHIFHTNCEEVWNYLSLFTQWNDYVHRVLALIDGKLVPVPINLTTVSVLLGRKFTARELKAYFDSVKLEIPFIRNSRDVVVSQVGEFLYEKIFRNYTFKQWGVYPERLPPEVAKRVPVRYDRDDRYFSDRYQGLPAEGYTRLFERILNQRNITLLLGMDYRQVIGDVRFEKLIYTGPIDHFFDNVHGRLPYRSLSFEFETLDCEVFQDVAVVNYPNDHAFTRVTEFKHMTLQRHPLTSIVREYPAACGEPYYPLLTEEALVLYGKYEREMVKLPSTYFIGRLAEYRYYNMDQAVKRALDLFETIAKA